MYKIEKEIKNTYKEAEKAIKKHARIAFGLKAIRIRDVVKEKTKNGFGIIVKATVVVKGLKYLYKVETFTEEYTKDYCNAIMTVKQKIKYNHEIYIWEE